MPEHITEYRYVPLEYRANEDRGDGDALGTITGVVMRYGDIATLPWGTEEFAPGAFGDLGKAELWADRMHQRTQPLANTLEGSLRFKDSPTELTTEIDLPDTTAGRDVEMEVLKGLMRGLSITFRTIKDELNYETNHRKVTLSKLFGWGVVDRPAYPRSKVDRWEEYLEYAERRAAYGDEPPVRVTPPPEPEPMPAVAAELWKAIGDEFRGELEAMSVEERGEMLATFRRRGGLEPELDPVPAVRILAV